MGETIGTNIGLMRQIVKYDRMGREDDDKPIATFERRTDFVQPLLSTDDIRRTVPNRQPMSFEGISHLYGKILVLAGMGKENFFRQHKR